MGKNKPAQTFDTFNEMSEYLQKQRETREEKTRQETLNSPDFWNMKKQELHQLASKLLGLAVNHIEVDDLVEKAGFCTFKEWMMNGKTAGEAMQEAVKAMTSWRQIDEVRNGRPGPSRSAPGVRSRVSRLF